MADAISWIHENIADHDGDPDRIFIGGHSAGGHYTSLLAVTSAWRENRDLPADIVRGCLPISGVYLFGEGSGLSVRPRFLGLAGNQAEQQASPQHYVTADAPPFLIAYGSEDFPHLRDQAERFAASLEGAGVAVEKIVFDGRDHFGASFAGGEPDGPWVSRAIEWMAAH